MSDDQPEEIQAGQTLIDETEAGDQDGDYMNMFTQVWVKLEVPDDEDEVEGMEESQTPPAETRGLRGSTLRQRDKEGVGKKRKYTKPEVMLECDQCSYKTRYKPSLKYHIMGHRGAKPYVCEHCPYSTKYPMSLKRHTVIQHECKDQPDKVKDLAVYHCSSCPYTTHFKWNLNSHERKHFMEKKFHCHLCPYSTAYKHNYEKHSRTHAKHGSEYQCDKCPFTTKYEGHITRHLAKVHREVARDASRCPHCAFSNNIKWRLNLHVNRSRQENELKCPKCEFSTNYQCAYREHRLTHAPARPPRQQGRPPAAPAPLAAYNPDPTEIDIKQMCLIKTKMDIDTGNVADVLSNYDAIKTKLDNESYYILNAFGPKMEEQADAQTGNMHADALSEHEKIHEYEVDPNCEVEWSNIQVRESGDVARPFQCALCGYLARYKASVQRHHQRRHTSQRRPYRCRRCSFATKTRDQIALHAKRSRSETTMQCTLCPFTTSFKCAFLVHERQHDPFRCAAQDCSYTCKKKYDMQRHFTTAHLGAGLRCAHPHCDFVAARKHSLLCHEASHAGTKPFTCHVSPCTYSSVRRSLRDAHVLRAHPSHSAHAHESVLPSGKVESLRRSVASDAGVAGDHNPLHCT